MDTNTGASSIDGAALTLGGGALQVTLLHSEASSSGWSAAYLASINGNTVGSTSQVQQTCKSVNVIPVLVLGCLGTSGSTGNSGTGQAQDLSATGGSGSSSLNLGASTTSADGFVGSAPSAAPSASAAASGPTGAQPPSRAAASLDTSPSKARGAASTGLPLTGMSLAYWLLTAAGLAGIGAVLLQLHRYQARLTPILNRRSSARRVAQQADEFLL